MTRSSQHPGSAEDGERGPSASVMRPRDLAEAREAMAGGRDPHSALLIVGGQTKLAWGRQPRAVDRVIATAGLDQLIGHDPGDMTATVGAGMPLSRLQEELARSGQWLAIDPPPRVSAPPRWSPVDHRADQLAAGATIGGIFASNDSGPSRLGYGSLRELVIGMTVILADGTVARSGSKVIKNVAGYDLCKLLCGALGTLGLVAELTVRLHPRPAHTRTVEVASAVPAACKLGLALMASPLEPAAVDHDGAALLIRFDGGATQVAAQAERAVHMAAQRGLSAIVLDDRAVAAERWQRMARLHVGGPGETVLRIASLPSQVTRVAAAL
ncbi:MAG: FAD-binding oxidoreductase, partial [Myxococcota bacterium]